MIYVALDLETTGLEPGSRMVELAAIPFDGSSAVAERWNLRINPGMPMPEDATKVNGLSQDAVSAAMPTAEALASFLDWLPADAVIVAHNASYDCSILSWEAARCGIVLPELRVIDTLAIARTLGETTRNGLQALVEHYGLQRAGDAHTAMCDADACRQYFELVLSRANLVPAEWPTDYLYAPPESFPEPLRELPELVAAGADFSFQYEDGKGAVTERTLVPYGWALKNGELYFHGLCRMRGERRTFRMDRVMTAQQEAA